MTRSREQYETVRRTVPHLVDMIEQGWRLVVSHGNGPQVGFILRRSELAAGRGRLRCRSTTPSPTPRAPSATCSSRRSPTNCARRGLERPVVAIVTQSVVDRGRSRVPAPEQADRVLPRRGERARSERPRSAGRSWRTPAAAGAVRSPHRGRSASSRPHVIRTLLDQGAVVVAARRRRHSRRARRCRRQLVGVEAVVDKDLASSLLATDLGADMLLIPTGVPQRRDPLRQARSEVAGHDHRGRGPRLHPGRRVRRGEHGAKGCRRRRLCRRARRARSA